MTESGDLETPKRRSLVRILAWVGSFLLLLVCLYVFLALLRGFMAWGGARWDVNAHDFEMTSGFVERMALFFMSIATLGLTVYFEHYYRVGAERDMLGQHIAKVFGIEIAVIVVAFLVQLLL